MFTFLSADVGKMIDSVLMTHLYRLQSNSLLLPVLASFAIAGGCDGFLSCFNSFFI